MNDNKELNDNLQRLFSTIIDAYGIASMIKDIKEKEVANKPLDYEILSYRSDLSGNVYKPKDLSPGSPDYPIHSVKRKSDNEIFSRKDVTDGGTIKAFYTEKNILWVRFEEKGGVVSLNDIQKVKERVPLFKTEDGKEIFEGDEIWFVRLKDTAHHSAWSIEYAIVHSNVEEKGYKIFSTEDKAKEYVLMNKPCLSLNDVISCSHVKNNYEGNQQFVKLKELAQQKINNQ